MTRRILKDGANYYGPYFPGNLAHRLVHFIHRHFKVPSCKIDFSRRHTHPCLQYHIHRCLGPCVAGLTTDEAYADAVKRRPSVPRRASSRPGGTSWRNAWPRLRKTCALKRRRIFGIWPQPSARWNRSRKMAAAQGEDIDIFAYHAEPPLVAVNLFHMRNGKSARPARFLLGRSGRFQPQRTGRGASETGLSQQQVHSRDRSTCRPTSKIEKSWKTF